MKVSIIAPTFNHEQYISQCINSVISQKVTDWELIVIDDGSTDKTVDIVKGYSDPRIVLIRNVVRNGIENLYKNYNAALAIAKGEFVAVLEGDDYWPEDKLSQQLQSFDKEEVVLTWGRTGRDAGGEIQEQTVPNAGRLSGGCAGVTEWLLLGNMIGAVTVMIRKSALVRIGGFWQPRGTIMVDYPTWLKLSTVGEFRYVPNIAGYWRIHPGQTTQMRRKEMLTATIVTLRDFLDESSNLQKISPRVRRFCNARILFLGAKIAHVEGFFLDAARSYMKVILWLHPMDRAQAIKLAARAAFRRPFP